MRIGAAHDLAASGIDLTSIMHSGGWTDSKMLRYTRGSQLPWNPEWRE